MTIASNSAAPGSGVIVVVDYHSHLPPAVEFAIALAHRRRLALHGLFIEDPDLASVSSLPFSQEVTLAGARPRALESEHLERTLKGFSRRFQQLLSQGAERAALDVSFGRVQGRRQAMQLGDDTSSHYLVLGQPGPAHRPGNGALRVLVVKATMAEALPVLESLQAMIADRNLELQWVPERDSTEDNRRLQGFMSGLSNAYCRHLADTEVAGELRPVGHTPDLVITSRGCAPTMLETLLKLAACPVIVTA